MMLPADRIQSDPSHCANNKQRVNPDHDFLAFGPALRILQLNVEGLSAAKRSIIGDIAARNEIDIVCL
jgi:hypothetical protein